MKTGWRLGGDRVETGGDRVDVGLVRQSETGRRQAWSVQWEAIDRAALQFDAKKCEVAVYKFEM